MTQLMTDEGRMVRSPDVFDADRRQQKLPTGGLLVGENVRVLADISAVRA